MTTLHGHSPAYQIGYRNGKEEVIDWLEDNAINYVGSDGITNWRDLYKELRNTIEHGNTNNTNKS